MEMLSVSLPKSVHPVLLKPLVRFLFSPLCLAVFLYCFCLTNTSANELGSVDSLRVELEAQAIVTIESEFGPYDFRLQEPLSSLGHQLQQVGNHEEALIAFDRALHVTRINHGLYEESQIEIVDSIIESNAALSNWDTVDKHYGYLENLYQRLYLVDDPRLETGLQKVVSWHVNALNVNLDGKRIEHLRQANKLFKLRLEIAEQTLRAGHPRFEFLEQNIKICEYQLYLASDLNKEMLRRQERARRNRSSALADLE